MRKSFLKIITGFISAAVMSVSTLATLPASAFTDSNGREWNPLIVAVTAVNEEGSDFYLTNGCVISQSEFRKYSGETFDLKYGDVLQVDCMMCCTTAPKRFAWGAGGEVPNIEYLGTAKDYYDTKELVVADKNDVGYVTFKDSDGEIYMWDVHRNTYNNPVYAEYLGYKIADPEFDPKLMEIGDKFECAVSTDEDYVGENRVDRNVVVMPVSVIEKAEVIPGDANDDKSVSIADLVIMQRYLTKVAELPFKNYANADLNNDGSVDVFGVIILRRKILYG